MRKLIVIGGATASGKSDCAVQLCHIINGEVISCDSMQLYRGMDIGTATPAEAEMDGIRHHLLSVLEPGVHCSAAAYREMALPVIEDILHRGKTPVLCGGTGLYINSLTRPLGFSIKGNDRIRRKLEMLDKETLHDKLEEVDPESASRLHPNDVRRVIRALEVYELTGISLTEHMKSDQQKSGDFEGILFALDFPREILYNRIERRVDRMMEAGLLQEVRNLMDSGLKPGSTAMQAIGYKELAAFFSGECTLDDAVRNIKQSTRHYAKRQLTWFRGDERTCWIPAEGKTAQEIAREIIHQLKEKMGQNE